MARNWTPAQLSAMETRGRTLLISAAAGSGKTATLTERIIRRLTDPLHPLDLSRLLIVTFTRAAAAELRDRIGGALSEAIKKDPANRHLRCQLLALGSAHISTIDAFVREPVKAHFAELGLPARNRIADEAELLPLCERVMEDLIEVYYIKYASNPSGELFSLLHENPFANLCDSLTSSKNDEALIPTFLSLYERLLSFPAELDRLIIEANELETYADKDFFESAHGTVLLEWLGAFCTSALTTLNNACNAISANEAAFKAYGKAFESDRAFITRLSEVSTYREAYDLLSTYQNERLGSLRGASEEMIAYKDARTELVKTIKDLIKKYFLDSPETVAQQMRETAQMCRVLHDFLTEYDRRILNEKKARGITDFTDNRRYLFHLLRDENGQPTPFAVSLYEQYDEVYIDEYQDVDELQDEIFRLVGGNHRFMVGDIKQSIYGFRGADPSVFARYRRDLPMLQAEDNISKSDSGNSIFMSDNFRCDESVIRITNAVCGHILRACPDSVGYTKADDLVYKKPVEDGYISPKVEITIVTKSPKEEQEIPVDDSGEEMSSLQAEVTHVANCIASLLRDGVTLANGEPIRPKDIAILMRTGNALSTYREVLTSMGIPTGSDELDAKEAGRDILHGEDMMYLVNLLRVIDDPDGDIPLSEILRAPFPGLSLEELLTVRRPKDQGIRHLSLFECIETYPTTEGTDEILCEKVVSFISWIEYYRSLCTTQPVAGILRLLSQDDRCACRGTDAFRYLYESARTCRSATFVSLYTFLRYFEKKLLTTKNAVTVQSRCETDGHVSLMTIHKSKGLEFPVCFVVRLGQTFSAMSLTPDLIFAKKAGIAMKLYRRETPHNESGNDCETAVTLQSQTKIDTTLRAATALAVKLTEREEEMRILYVAMTRARERLYLVGHGNQKPVHFQEGDRFATLSATNYLRWILGGLNAHPEVQNFCELRYISLSDIVPGPRLCLSRKEMISNAENEIICKYRRLAETRHDLTAMETLLGRVPTKVPASRMKDRMLDTCVFYDTDLPLDEGGKLPADVENTTWCDAQSIASLQESLRLMSSSNHEGVNEFEMLLGENRRPTAAERGTAAHVFLQFCDYDRVLSAGLEEEISRLAVNGFLHARTVQVLDRSALHTFFNSQFFAHAKEAIRMERERRFTRFVPLASLTADPAFAEALGDRTLYVQGSIDMLCEFSDGHIEIADYKTDRITEEERKDPSLLADRMKERHGDQLRQYVEAVFEMYGKRPTRVYIYSLPLGEAVEIDI